MITFEQFQDSLKDLNPEEQTAKLIEFSKQKDEEFRTLQSASQKGVNDLKQGYEDLFAEAKKVGEDENYIHELIKKDPAKAEMIVKHFGNGLTLEDVKGGRTMPKQTVDVKSEIIKYEAQKEAQQSVDKFIKSIGLNESEKEEFMKKMNTIRGDRDLPASELKPILAGLALEMGRKVSTSKEGIMGEHNVVNFGGGNGSGQGSAGEYKPQDSSTMDFLYQQGAIRKAPSK